MYSLYRHGYDVDPFVLRAEGVHVSDHYVNQYNKNKAKKDLYDQIETDDHESR
jgi:hypothetical protein